MRNFLTVSQSSVLILTPTGDDAGTLPALVEGLQQGRPTIQLIWGAVVDIRCLKCTPPENVAGKCIPVGWHQHCPTTKAHVTETGDKNPFLLSLQQPMFTHLLTAIEQLAFLARKQ